MLLFGDPRIQCLVPEGQSSSLEAIYGFLYYSYEMESVKINLNSEDKTEKFHSAGFDSYITGIYP